MKIVDYKPNYGVIRFPDGFVEKLQGKAIDEQMKCFRLSMSDTYSRSSYGAVTSENVIESTYSLDEYYRCTGLIVRDEMVVGVMIRDFSEEEVPCLPYCRVTTFYTNDSDGAGYYERDDYVQLICI